MTLGKSKFEALDKGLEYLLKEHFQLGNVGMCLLVATQVSLTCGTYRYLFACFIFAIREDEKLFASR